MNSDNQLAQLSQLSSVLAHSVVFFARERVGTLDLFAGGDPPAPSTQESMDSILKAYTANLPQLMKVTGQNILPYEQSVVDANKALAPQQNQLSYDMLSQYGPQFTELGNKLNGIAGMGQAQNDLAVLQGPGKELAAAQLAAQKLADPEFYKTRELGLGAMEKLFGALPDPNGGLSGAEREEVTRSLARDNSARGNENPSASTTVENAMRFGAAGEARKKANEDRIANAVGAATQFMPASKSGIDVLNTTTGRPTISNPGQTQFMGVGKDTGAATQNLGGQLFGATSTANQQSNQINANRRDSLDRFSQVMGSMPSVSCCWIFLAAHGGELPWYVRKARDVYGTDQIRRGYKRMSIWLVPILKRSAIARWIVRTIMTEPLTMFAGWQLRAEGCHNGKVFMPLRDFYFALWNKLGKEN